MDVNNGMKVKKIDNGRELFYGVIAIASFIVMAVGATFAYFTATANSANSSIGTGSTTLELEYISYNQAWMKDDLIPANTAVVEYSVEYQDDSTMKEDGIANGLCVDDYGNSICSVYQFKIVNNANSPQVVSLDIVSEINGFASLNAMAYELSVEDDPDNDVDDDKAIYDQGAYATEEDEETGEQVPVNNSTDPKFHKTEPAGTEGFEGYVTVTLGDKNTPLYDDDFTNNEPIYINRKGVTKNLLKYKDTLTSTTDNPVMKPAIDRLVVPVTEDNQSAEASAKTVRVADQVTIYGMNDPEGNPNYKHFAIILYIRNSSTDQTKTDAAKSFTGRVVVSNGDGGTGVSGSISAVADDQGNVNSDNALQSELDKNQPGVSE